MPGFTLEKMVGAILVIIGFIIFAIVLFGMKAGASFWYMGCEGDIGGTHHAVQDIWVYDNQRCTIIQNETMCEITFYKNITKENRNLTVCMWLPDTDPNTPDCYFNAELTCEDFSQRTIPKCNDIPNCMPVSAIKMAVDRLKPQ
jgi:hypothetical protein